MRLKKRNELISKISKKNLQYDDKRKFQNDSWIRVRRYQIEELWEFINGVEVLGYLFFLLGREVFIYLI